LGCDATFGSSREFLDRMSEHYWYFEQVRSSTLVWTDNPQRRPADYGGTGRPPRKPQVIGGRRVTVKDLAADPQLPWKTVKLGEGAKGPIRSEVTMLRVAEHRDDLPGAERWLFIRRYDDGHLKYALSNAPADIPRKDLIRASTLRWPIEQCFQEGKGQLGMDHYEHRSWPAWHRHMLFVFLAGLFLLDLRHKFKKNSGANPGPGTPTGGGGLGGASNQRQGSADHVLPDAQESPSIPVPSEEQREEKSSGEQEIAPLKRRNR